MIFELLMSLTLLIPFFTSAILGLVFGSYFLGPNGKVRPIAFALGVLVVFGQIYLLQYLVGNLYDSSSIFYPISYTCIYFFFTLNQRSSRQMTAFILTLASIIAVMVEQGGSMANYLFIAPIPVVMSFFVFSPSLLRQKPALN